MTTDTRPKEACRAGTGFTVAGMAKGSGMIHPNLATMLAVVTTDYALEPGEARTFLAAAVERSFNSISVDGECSTNDTVVLLANGAADVERSAAGDARFAAASTPSAATWPPRSSPTGEGATLVAEISVTGAVEDSEARAIARRIATSPLVKTALFGRDPNWGRVLAAAGSAPWNGGYAHLDPERVTLRLNGVTVVAAADPRKSSPTSPARAARSSSTSDWDPEALPT